MRLFGHSQKRIFKEKVTVLNPPGNNGAKLLTWFQLSLVRDQRGALLGRCWPFSRKDEEIRKIQTVRNHVDLPFGYVNIAIEHGYL